MYLGKIKKIIDIVNKPLVNSQKFIVFFTIYFILYRLIPFFYETNKISFQCIFWEVFLLGYILGFFPVKVGKYLKILFAFIIICLVWIEFFLVQNFAAGIGPQTFDLLVQTNLNETKEFFQTYVFDGFIVVPLFCFLISLFCYSFIELFSFKNRIFINKKISSLSYIIFWMFFIYTSSPVFQRWRYVSDILNFQVVDDVKDPNHFYMETPFQRLTYSFGLYRLSARQMYEMRNYIIGYNVESKQEEKPKIVFVLGESANRKHSQLYGYELATTPFQFEWNKKGNLIKFNDVISCWNGTDKVFKYALSLYSLGNENIWYKEPLFPAVFKQAGFDVLFFSNQFPKIIDNLGDYFCGYYILDPVINEKLFSYHNDRKFKYDEDIVLYADSVLSLRNNNLPMFIFYHLQGQHFSCKGRYPDKWSFFNVENYSKRTNLNEEQKLFVSEYDNATLYNDFVLNEIINRYKSEDAIIVYMSDHGEEVYDDNLLKGRQHNINLNDYICVRNEFEIPFWIWCSDSFIEKRPEFFNQIKNSSNNPYMIDDISHTLLYIAGIKCDGYDESKSIISPNFNKERKRLIKGEFNYELLLKKN